ncbi:methionine--tRNA ligase [Methanobacterium subterraneum]|uniref:Methionine--tRNA ligase n=1 Tax=Methanobacterium subterraneum TaxID=59277 RepID=A0A2H4VEB1_9EURY|nr:methionine--tRNA ligase [Methanobacterium subterraneum]AUB56429.1 methionine--tRNA ligase [Methanobacterium subterraneum]
MNKDSSKLFITCALPYANGPCHLGHLRSTYIPADIYARYHRMKGTDVLFVCATDEHGTPIAVQAEKEGISPMDIATRNYELIRKDLELSDISFDNFSRTTDPLHYEISQNFFLDLYQKNCIYPKTIQQLYCGDCDRFLPDRYVEGTCPHCSGEGARGDHCETCGRHLEPVQLVEPKCLICQSNPEIRESNQYYFRLSHFQEQLKECIQDNPELPANVRNYTMQWINEGLKDWILTRDMDWGIPVPLDDAEGKIIYVWGEAFLGYISSAAQWARRENTPWEPYWDDRAVHFIGKDIIYHHSIFWQAMLMAYGCKLPYNIVAGEYLSLEGLKMSTSKNWVIWAADFMEKFDSDLLRYYLVANAPLTRDTDFSWDDFQRRVNDELADVVGNFLHRTFSFTHRFFQGEIPRPGSFNDYDQEVKDEIIATPKRVGEYIESFDFREGLKEIIKLAKLGNKYFNDQEPWKTVKEEGDRSATTLYLCNQLAKVISVIISPYLPVKAGEMREILGLSHDKNDILKWEDSTQFIPAGTSLIKAKPLFAKIDDETIEKEKNALYTNLEETETMDNLISIEDFAKLDLRVGKIIGAEKVKGSEKLLKLMVDVKDKQLQVVAGLATKYSSEDLLNQKVIILVNLKPAKLFGIKSEGMVLAAGDSSCILTAPDAGVGEGIR